MEPPIKKNQKLKKISTNNNDSGQLNLDLIHTETNLSQQDSQQIKAVSVPPQEHKDEDYQTKRYTTSSFYKRKTDVMKKK